MNIIARLPIILSMLTALLVYEGCARRSHNYTVEIVNRTGGTIYNALSSFDDGTWKFEFGDIIDGAGKSYLGESMPPLPRSATVSWKAANGAQLLRKVNLSSVSGDELEGGELSFTISAEDEVTVKFQHPMFAN